MRLEATQGAACSMTPQESANVSRSQHRGRRQTIFSGAFCGSLLDHGWQVYHEKAVCDKRVLNRYTQPLLSAKQRWLILRHHLLPFNNREFG